LSPILYERRILLLALAAGLDDDGIAALVASVLRDFRDRREGPGPRGAARSETEGEAEGETAGETEGVA